MRSYEVTFIMDPVLSESELKGISKTYQDLLNSESSKITHVDHMGLKQLAYPIKKRTTGIYQCIEFQNETGEVIDKLELALRRDERIMRFLTIGLDKFGVKYNDDKRNGLIGKKKKEVVEEVKKEVKAEKKEAKPAAKAEAKPAPAPATPASKEEE